jgi:hypothetical protein
MAGIKGALISFAPTFDGTSPNVIAFQINPETITHSWDQPGTDGGDEGEGTRTSYDPLAVPGVPSETFSFTLSMDANNEIADFALNPVAGRIATAVGAYARIAALEMLQYPIASASALLGSVSAGLEASGLGAPGVTEALVPASQVPVVLFVWGAQRIVPVRVTKLEITEKLFNSSLNPLQADAQITLTVLTPDELAALQGPMRDIANTAYEYTQALRQVQAAGSLGEAAISEILGMLPVVV